MTIDETINTWLAPVGEWLSAVMFYSVPVLGAQLPLILVWLIAGGVVCTLAFRFVNLRGFRHSSCHPRDLSSKDHPGETSPFQALSAAFPALLALAHRWRGARDRDRRSRRAFWMVSPVHRHEHQVRGVTLAVKYARCARTER